MEPHTSYVAIFTKIGLQKLPKSQYGGKSAPLVARCDIFEKFHEKSILWRFLVISSILNEVSKWNAKNLQSILQHFWNSGSLAQKGL